MNAELRQAISKLIESDSGQLPISKFTKAQESALAKFGRSTRAVVRVSKGRGVVFRIDNKAVLLQHYKSLVPLGNETVDSSLPQRAVNIGETRGSKSSSFQHDVFYLLLKSQGKPSWENDEGATLNLQRLSADAGAAALTIDMTNDSGWASASPLWLVENQALFDRIDWLPSDEPITVAYYQGQLRSLFLDWLSAKSRAPNIVIFPDYDGVGLQNYQRLRHGLGAAVSFWLMPDWKDRLIKFGNNELWQKTLPQFNAAVSQLEFSDEDEVGLLANEMSKHGLALEQESIWLDL